MASVVDRPRAVPTTPPAASGPAPTEPPGAADGGPRPARRPSAAALLDTALLAVLLVLTAVVRALGSASAPQRTDTEGSLVAAAWATLQPGTDPTGAVRGAVSSLARLEVAGWFAATGAVERAPHAVAAGREVALVAALVTTVLLWVLARRLDLPRWAAALAVVLTVASPAALELQRVASATALAVPWALAALLLVRIRHRPAAALAGSAACLVVAGLTDPTLLLVLPGVAVVLFRRRARDEWAVVGAVSVLLLAAVGATFAASVLGSPVVALGRVEGVTGPGAVVVAVVLVAAGVGLVLRRLRPAAVVVLVLLAAALAGRDPLPLAGPAAVALVPFAALVVAGSVDGFVRYRPTRLGGRPARRATGVLGALVAVGLVLVLAPGWADGLRRLTTGTADAPVAAAAAWLERAVPDDAVVLTGAGPSVDLLRQGRAPERVVPLRASSVPAGGGAWWALVTASTRRDPAAAATLATARERGELAAAFGSGPQRVEVLRVAAVAPVPAPSGPEGPSAEATALLENPAVEVSDEARRVLGSERVDDRLVTLLALLASRHPLTVDALPPSDDGGPRRTARITEVEGSPATRGSPSAADVVAVVAAQPLTYRAVTSWSPATGGAPPALVLTVPEPQP